MSKHLGNHLGAIVGSDIGWGAFEKHGIGQGLDDTDGIDPPGDPDGQAFATVLIDQRQQAQTPAVMGLCFDKVETPDVVGAFGPKPDAGSTIEPEPTLYLNEYIAIKLTRPASRQ